MSTATNGILRIVVSALQTPVVLVLLAMMVLAVIMVGGFVVEYFTERRYMKENIPKLIEDINSMDLDGIAVKIKNALILNRQRTALLKLIGATGMDAVSREAYASQLLFDEEEHYRKYLRHSESLLRLAPMFGLLGTLIPLGPGLIALGKGNTQALSESLLVAFDTTSLGVIIAAVAFVVYQLRKSWYKGYTKALESVMEVILDKQSKGDAHAKE